jgi:hypothetical protein
MLKVDIKDFRPRCFIKKLINNQVVNGVNSKLENQIATLDPLGQWILQNHEIAIMGFTRKDIVNDNGICIITDFDKYKKKYLMGTSPSDRKHPVTINRILESRGLPHCHDRYVQCKGKTYFFELKTRDVEPGIHALIDYCKLKEQADDKELQEIEEEERKKKLEKEKERQEMIAKRDEEERKLREEEEKRKLREEEKRNKVEVLPPPALEEEEYIHFDEV